jgi:anti-sigma factor RsiW
MNCAEFQNQLHEHVEGTLAASARAAAQAHLAGCEACRRVVRAEQQFAEHLKDSIRRETASLTLRPEVWQAILLAARRKPVAPTLGESIVGLWKRFAWQAAISACMVLGVGGLLIIHFAHPATNKLETARSNERSPHAVVSEYPSVSIQIASRLPAWKFRQDGDLVMDTLSYETVIASGTLVPGGHNPKP